MTNSSFAQLHELVQDTRRRRALASDAEAFVHFFLERILHLSDDAIEVAVTHGPADGGIDAVHIDQEGAHVVACDYADSVAESRRPIARARLAHLVSTWVAIASNTDSELALSSALRRRIGALHHYWDSIEGTHIPHDIYLVTNREHSGIDRTAIQRQMNYYQTHSYHYFEQADLVDPCHSATSGPER